QDQVWGIAYNIGEEDQEKVMAHLDYREKDGYHRKAVLFHPQDNSIQPWHLTLYLGADSNPFYTGPTNENTIAEIISLAAGPSGPNSEYLFQLAEAMRTFGVSDSHLFDIEAKVKNILSVV
ncbi:hypothetical protein OTU49_007927, partial [Cherax quadricarinatus]